MVMSRRFSISVDIGAPPDRVWAVVSDIERWPEWTPSVKSIQRLDSGPLAPGKRARVHQPRLLPATWVVTEMSRGHSFTWVTSSPGIRVTARHAVYAAAAGSRATLSLVFSGLLSPVVAWLTRSLNDRYLQLEAGGLKRRAEEGSGTG
jgi:uncharacterized membrane protein